MREEPVKDKAVAADVERGDDVYTRVDEAAMQLFGRRGFAEVTAEEVADAAGISRRTFFRYFPTKADAVWGDFAGHVARLARLLENCPADQSVLASICAAYIAANDYPAAEQELLRKRLRLILTEPALQAHSQLRYADVDRVVAGYVGRRTHADAAGMLPRLVATTTRAAATTAFEVWLRDPAVVLSRALHAAFDELSSGFPSLRLASG